jgi:DUF4097 and DUF4098 domain-containing protein YvlB
MSEAPATGSRSGCALFLGVVLIAAGVLFLAQNLFAFSLLPVLRRSFLLFVDYWPLLLVLWGAFKVYQRFAAPERARVGGFEILLLVFLLLVGLSVSFARHVAEQVTGGTIEDLIEVPGWSLAGPDFQRFAEEARFELGDATGLTLVNPGGRVSVRGVEGAAIEVRLTKRVRHRSESEASAIAEKIELAFTTEGSSARLAVVVPSRKQERWSSIECDLEVLVPRTASVGIENRHGPVSVADMLSPVRIETAQDGIEAENLKAGLEARTRHGDIRVRGVAGSVSLFNRGGAIAAEDVEGDLRAETHHGRILAEDVTGAATLETQHAPVRASRIGGELRAKTEHDEISVETAGANVIVANQHGSVFVRDVAGDLSVTAESSPVQARQVKGNVSIDNHDEAVTVVGVGGMVRVRSPMSPVTVEEAKGPIEVESSYDDVRIADFGSSLTIRSTHADVSVGTADLGGNVSVRTSYGDVELRIPASASLKLAATTKDGELHSNLPALDPQESRSGSERSWTAALGSETYTVSIETSYGDVNLVPEAS